MMGLTTAAWLLAASLQTVLAYPNGFVSHQAPESGALRPRQFPDPSSYEWSKITPKRELEWHDCYDGFQCARLIVPMDYADCRSNRTVALAVIMLPATDRGENYLGPLFVNPGGPGGSGIDYVLFSGQSELQPYFGANHDIISWDPRGVAKSTPKQSCFANNQRRAFWSAPWAAYSDGYDFDDPAYLAQSIQKYKHENANCDSMLGGIGIREHIHSEAHARDMDSILRAMGRDKLRYFGFSYGSVIAVHYASLFPDKVERILSEANVDVEAAARADAFASLGDARRTKEYLYARCSEEPSCPFHEATPALVGARIDALIADLRLRPRMRYRVQTASTILANDASARADIDYIFRLLSLMGPWLLDGLAQLEGDELMRSSERDYLNDDAGAAGFWEDIADTSPSRPNDPDYEGGVGHFLQGWTEEITFCGDGLGSDVDLETITEEYRRGRELTPSALWGLSWKLACAGAVPTKKKFKGPFGGNTSFPLLFVNGWDIITPMSGAHHNAALFPGSPVVQLDAYGHGPTRYSRCVWKLVSAYFQNGTVPEHNATCADYPPLKFGTEFKFPNTVPWLDPGRWDNRTLARRDDQREHLERMLKPLVRPGSL